MPEYNNYVLISCFNGEIATEPFPLMYILIRNTGLVAELRKPRNEIF